MRGGMRMMKRVGVLVVLLLLIVDGRRGKSGWLLMKTIKSLMRYNMWMKEWMTIWSIWIAYNVYYVSLIRDSIPDVPSSQSFKVK